MTNEVFKRQLEERTLVFSIQVLNFLAKLPNKSIFG